MFLGYANQDADSIRRTNIAMSLPKDLHLLAKEQPLSSEWIFADNIMRGIIKSRPNKKLLK